MFRSRAPVVLISEYLHCRDTPGAAFPCAADRPVFARQSCPLSSPHPAVCCGGGRRRPPYLQKKTPPPKAPPPSSSPPMFSAVVPPFSPPPRQTPPPLF